MNVGIVTQPLYKNYGGIMQNYALHQILIKLGHNPITLRIAGGYQKFSPFFFWFYIYPRYFISFILRKMLGRNVQRPKTLSEDKRQYCRLEKFIENNINVTPLINKLAKNDLKKYNIDVIIVGSDQTWRPEIKNYLWHYFCGFTEGYSIKKITYGASFSVDKWPFNKEDTVKAKSLIQEFSFVSIREISGVDLCKKYLNVDACWVLDPTLLIDKEAYMDICKGVPYKANNSLLIYFLDSNNEKLKTADSLAKSLGCEIFNLSSIRGKENDTIENWLACFRDTKFVVTDSFHGAIFSLIFQRDFVCFYNEKRGNARMDSLKELTGLKDNFISSSDVITIPHIDYREISEKIDKMKNISLDFLESSL